MRLFLVMILINRLRISRHRKGFNMSLRVIIMIIIFLIFALATVPTIASGSESAEKAALSCPGWKSEWADRLEGVELC